MSEDSALKFARSIFRRLYENECRSLDNLHCELIRSLDLNFWLQNLVLELGQCLHGVVKQTVEFEKKYGFLHVSSCFKTAL